MQRFFFTEAPLRVNSAVDLTPLAHQLHKVLRLQPGEIVILLDNQGSEYAVSLTAVQARYAAGAVLTQSVNQAEPSTHLTLYQCSLKADKFEWVLQKGTELGVSCFVPVISERSIVRPAAALLKKYERWRTILREAAEQCGRGHIPTLFDPVDWLAALRHTAGLRLLPWEAEQLTAPHLYSAAMQQRLQHTPTVALLIGPEGGIATAEAAQAQAAGWQPVSLGPRILRAETAALAAVTLILATPTSS
jgi:16S rRNA (uracil1498-N3)-methyltransferase